jgi:hypothetical protein
MSIVPPFQPDVVVAGGGTAGCAASIAAARRGHRVLLVEEGNCLGGVSTAGGVSEFYASREGLGDIFDRVREELTRHGAIFGRYYNGETLKIIWQLLCDQAGVDMLFHTSVVDAEQSNGTIRRVRAVSCSHFFELEARCFVDTTGEGDLAALAGADFERGHPETGRTLHMSLTCTFCDTGQTTNAYLPPGLEEIRHPDDLPGLRGPVELPDNRLYCNMTKIMGHDPIDPFSLSQAERKARRQLARIVHYVQTRHPTFALCSSGSKIGIREGRRIAGDYVLTEKDITGAAPRVFEDGVAVATSQIDFHSLSRPGSGGWRQRVEPYAIPFRCLTPKGLKNLLVAGKCISGDQVAQSSYRMTPTCCAMGQAAGTAAALYVEKQITDVRQISAAELQAELIKDKMELDPRKHRAFAPEITPDPARGA